MENTDKQAFVSETPSKHCRVLNLFFFSLSFGGLFFASYETAETVKVVDRFPARPASNQS